jgi:hypothetical protein
MDQIPTASYDPMMRGFYTRFAGHRAKSMSDKAAITRKANALARQIAKAQLSPPDPVTPKSAPDTTNQPPPQPDNPPAQPDPIPPDTKIERKISPTRDTYVSESLRTVREHIRSVDEEMKKFLAAGDSLAFGRLADARSRLAEQERYLADRPSPGSKKPREDKPLDDPDW